MANTNGVMGPTNTDDLGFTLSHEHVGTNAAGLRRPFPEIVDLDGTRERSIAAMRACHADGVRTIVDVSTFDLGRDVQLIREVALGSDLRVIVATGKRRDVPKPSGDISPDVIAQLYVREAEEGIEGPGIKAGNNFIPCHVPPRPKELGASDARMRRITVENPRRFFAGE